MAGAPLIALIEGGGMVGRKIIMTARALAPVVALHVYLWIAWNAFREPIN